MEKDEQTALLKELLDQLESSKLAYQQYLAGGKTFRFAQELKKYNSAIMLLLQTKGHLLSDALQQDAAALLFHYHAWTTKWEQLAAAIHPQPDDLFVFENDVTFPRQAAGNLEAVYLNLQAKT
ncbi:MAG: hypothetical protein JNM19_02005 [Chitinophagaceae bacterium]|nr:hypothetical protein [Chitinophagaceae bacterium]